MNLDSRPLRGGSFLFSKGGDLEEFTRNSPNRMLTLTQIREERDQIIEALSKRGIDVTDSIDKIIELDKERRSLQKELDDTLAESNSLSRQIGELMKAGVMFHPKSPYHAVCADVVLVNPPGTLPNHTHTITPNPSSSSSQNLKEISLSICDID